MKLTKGELVAISNGEYSDYCVNGLFKVLKDFDAKQMAIEWGGANGMQFVPWLCIRGYLEDVEYREMHTGCYGETEITEF